MLWLLPGVEAALQHFGLSPAAGGELSAFCAAM